MKELAKASEDEKPLSSHKKSISEFEVLFFQKIEDYSIFTSTPTWVEIDNYYFDNYAHLLVHTSFRPPTLA